MKKIALLLALTLCIGFTACGEENDNSQAETSVQPEASDKASVTVTEAEETIAITTVTPEITAVPEAETKAAMTEVINSTTPASDITTATPVTTTAATTLKPVDPKYKLNVYCNNGFEISPALRNEIESTIASYPIKNGFYVQTIMTDDLSFGYNENIGIEKCGITNLGFAAYVTQQIQAGNGDMWETLKTDQRYFDGEYTIMNGSDFHIGEELPLCYLDLLCIKNDQTALNMLKERYGVKNYNNWLKKVGCTNSEMIDNNMPITSAKDAAIMWKEYSKTFARGVDNGGIGTFLVNDIVWLEPGVLQNSLPNYSTVFRKNQFIESFNETGLVDTKNENSDYAIAVLTESNGEKADQEYVEKIIKLCDKVMAEYREYLK